MQNTSGIETSQPHRRGARLILSLILTAALCGGCTEFVVEGIVSDRDTARPLPGVSVQQQRLAGWRELGVTDGKGQYWILKHHIDGGGRIRMTKSGYRPTDVSEGEFLTGQSFLLVPTDSNSDF